MGSTHTMNSIDTALDASLGPREMCFHTSQGNSVKWNNFVLF